MGRPDYLAAGSQARLFPVLATTSKEGRTTEIVLACMTFIHELGHDLLKTVGVRVGVRSKISSFTEVRFVEDEDFANRPDGLLIVQTGKKEWRALIETKIASATLDVEQIERYRALAKRHNIDCLITISNKFAASPQLHPNTPDLNKRLKVPVFHWSWSFILTQVDLLLSNQDVADTDQAKILEELQRFLTHESAGVKGFDRMPKEWSDMVRLVSSGGSPSRTSSELTAVINAWHQETKDLSLIMSRMVEATVLERLSKDNRNSPERRFKDVATQLVEHGCLHSSLDVPDAASPLDICIDLKSRSISVCMKLKAPEDRKSSKARVNWLLRQLPDDLSEDHFIRAQWPGRSASTQHSVSELRAKPERIEQDKGHLQVHTFEIVRVHKLGAKLGQQTNFITELEKAVPAFYGDVGQRLTAWLRKAPKIKDTSVSVSEMSEELEDADND